MTSRRPIARATALLVVSACSFGSISTLTVFATGSGLSLLSAMFWRYMLAGLVLAVIVRRSAFTSIGFPQAARLVAVGGFGQAFITYFSLRALDYVPVGPLGFLFYTYPAWVAIMAAITGREELSAPRLIALTVAMAGIAVMIGAPSAASLRPIGIALGLGAAFFYALYLPALHEAQKGIAPLVSAFYLVAGVFMAFLVASILTGDFQFPESPSSWAFVLMLAIVGTVIAFVSLIGGLRVLGPLLTSIIATVEPFFTALLGIFLLGEPFTLATATGGAMIAGAVLLLQWSSTARLEPESAD